MPPLNIWLIVGIITILQGVLLSVAIFFKSSKNSAANVLLGIFVCFVSLSLVGRISPYISSWKDSFLLSGLMDIIIFSYGPLSYFYLKNLLKGPCFPKWKDYYHFIPLAIFLTYFFYVLLFHEHFLNSILRKNLGYLYLFLELLAIVSNAIYLYVGYQLVRNYEKKMVKQLSCLPQIKYIKIFLAIISIIVFLWFAGFISKYIPILQFATVFTYNSMWILISLLTFLFAYFSFFEPEILFIQPPQNKYEQGYFPSDYYEELKVELNSVMKKEQPFLNPKLTLSELAKMMEKTPRDLSRVINEGYSVNFYEFINTHRVNKFKELIEKEKNKEFTILSLAFESGFNSKATFNSAFKKIEKCTPREYIKMKKC